MTTRRDFLLNGVASASILALPRTARAATPRFDGLNARQAAVQLAPPSYPTTEIWGYDGTMPGPELRIAQGTRVQRSFLNDLPQACLLYTSPSPRD